MENNKEKFNIKIFLQRLFYLISLAGGKTRKLVFFVFFLEIFSFADPYLLKLIIDKISNFETIQFQEVFFLVALMLFFKLFTAFWDYRSDIAIVDFLLKIENNLFKLSHGKMMELSLGYHEKENTGNKISKIQRGIDKMNALAGNFFWDILPTILQTSMTLIFLIFIDWRFGLVYFSFVPVFLYLTLKGNSKIHPQRIARHKGYEEASGIMAQSIININTVKSFVQEGRETKNLSSVVNKLKENAFKEFMTIFLFNWYRSSVIILSLVLTILFGVHLISIGAITIGSMVFVVTISQKALSSLFRISKLYDRVMEGSEPVNRLYSLMIEEADIVSPSNGFKPGKIVGQIEFCGANFSYADAKEKALSDINLKIHSGCTTALVGPSGGGKTTLARMVYRHYDPQSGQVLLDGHDLREYNLHAFRRFMAIVPQEVEIFDMTIGENIAYARPRVSREEIEAAARIANAEEFIKKLPDGYRTKVGERGVRLSGGQRQRIGIARAILANPAVLIFDEATSSLDSYSERLIQDAMDKITKNRTVIIIAHRLSTIKKADKIVVLESGKVAEQGSHHELSRANGGLYAKLLKLQEFGDVD